MNKQTFNRWLIVVLVLCNGALVIFLLTGKPPHPPQPKEIIIEKLHFNAEQIREYETLIHEHQEGIQHLDRSIRKTKRELYGQLKDAKTSSPDSLIAQITALQSEVEQLHYHHFEDIKSLCKPEQIPLFNELTNELAGLFAPRPPRRR